MPTKVVVYEGYMFDVMVKGHDGYVHLIDHLSC
jgi:hypothetical protein